MANSMQNIRKLVKDGFVIRKPTNIHSRSHVRQIKEAKKKWRHYGYVKLKGTTEARLPTKILWMRTMSVLKCLLSWLACVVLYKNSCLKYHKCMGHK